MKTMYFSSAGSITTGNAEPDSPFRFGDESESEFVEAKPLMWCDWNAEKTFAGVSCRSDETELKELVVAKDAVDSEFSS